VVIGTHSGIGRRIASVNELLRGEEVAIARRSPIPKMIVVVEKAPQRPGYCGKNVMSLTGDHKDFEGFGATQWPVRT
jgi:hypothetical protein